MKVLSLVLKGKWFRMIESGIKTEEYRNITNYWQKRLSKYTFDAVVFYHGYSKGRPEMTFRIESIIHGDFGKTEWGAESCTRYFVIKLGERIA